MPVRSLSSSVLRWPDREEVDRSARAWIGEESERHEGLQRVGYFGSYARGDWGVGSDLDLIAVVKESQEPFERRSLSWDLYSFPVPAELLVYTEKEWQQLQKEKSVFWCRLQKEVVWIFENGPAGP